MLFGLRISLQAHHNDLQEWREACTDMLSDEGPGCAVPATESFEEVFGWRSVKAVLWPSADLGFRARQLWGRLSRSVRRASRVLRSLVWRDAHIHRDGLEQEHAWQLLAGLMNIDPEHRTSAAEALLGSYLNSDCTEGELPVTAPEPWTLAGLLSATGVAPAQTLVTERCPLPDYVRGEESFSAVR